MQWASVVFACPAYIPPFTISRPWAGLERDPVPALIALCIWGATLSFPTNLPPHCLPWRADLWLRPKQTLQPFLLATGIGSKWMCVSSQTREIQFKEFYWSDWKREFLFPEMNLRGCQPGPTRAALWQIPHSRRKTETNYCNKLEPELNPASCRPEDGSFSSIQEIIRSLTHGALNMIYAFMSLATNIISPNS